MSAEAGESFVAEPVSEHELTGAEVGSQVSLRIATHTIRFRAAGPAVTLFLHDNHLPFRVPDDSPADCEVRWGIGELTVSPVEVSRRFEDRWEIRPLGDGREEITFYNPLGPDLAPQPAMQMVSDADFAVVEVRQAPREGNASVAYVSEYPWAEYIIQRRLGLSGAAMLHASMAVFDGEAHLFLGHSGAGKSTIAELAEQVGAVVPTDDRTIVTLGPDGPLAWGTPWHGSFRRTAPDSAPVASVSLLVQYAEDHIERIGVGRAVKEMYVRTVQSRVTEREVHATLEVLEAVAGQVPFYELRFRPTTAAVEMVLAAVRGGAAT